MENPNEMESLKARQSASRPRPNTDRGANRLGALETDARMHLTGLSANEAASRLSKDGLNRLPGNAPKSLLAILLNVAGEPMFLMLLFAGGIYLLLGDKTEAVFLTASVFVIILITLIQERKSQRALESLRDLSAPRALVIRDGQKQRISGQDVVRGDMLVVREGDRIAADGVLITGNVYVDESLLSGESVSVLKLATALSDRNDQDTIAQTSMAQGQSSVFASTVVTKGEGIAQVVATGAQTVVGKIGQSLSDTDSISSGLGRASRKIVWQLTLLGLLTAVMLFVVSWLWDKRPILESALTAVALVMAVLPEEIPVVLTVFLAIGAWRMSKKKVLTRQISGLEALGAISILAVDKTGTITQNRMQVAALSVGEADFLPSDTRLLPAQFHELGHFAALACPVDPFDPMEKAIQNFAHQQLTSSAPQDAELRLKGKYDLSPALLAMTNVYTAGKSPYHVIATKGAPEAVLALCRLPEEVRERIQSRVTAMAETGLRVLGVAKGSWQPAVLPENQQDFEFSFLGLMGFADPPRLDVKEAIAECRSAGIRVIMMTGDHPATATAIGKQVGLSAQLKLITGADADKLNDEQLAQKLTSVDLFARLKPEQKLRLVKLLQSNGEIVAMTGDGVNDAPALQAANIGIAMGERGTDVAREAADLVLLDDSFASIVLSIRQGRRIYDNITCAIRFIFAVHVPIVALALFPTLFHWPILLLPLHIVLLELIIDPACSIVFEAEPEASNIMRRPPRKLDHSPFSLSNIGYAVVQGIGVGAILLFGYWTLSHASTTTESQARAIVFISLVIGILLLVLVNRDPAAFVCASSVKKNAMYLWLTVLVAGMLFAVTVVPVATKVLQFQLPHVADWRFAVLMVALMLIWLAVLRRAKQRYTDPPLLN